MQLPLKERETPEREIRMGKKLAQVFRLLINPGTAVVKSSFFRFRFCSFEVLPAMENKYSFILGKTNSQEKNNE